MKRFTFALAVLGGILGGSAPAKAITAIDPASVNSYRRAEITSGFGGTGEFFGVGEFLYEDAQDVSSDGVADLLVRQESSIPALPGGASAWEITWTNGGAQGDEENPSLSYMDLEFTATGDFTVEWSETTLTGGRGTFEIAITDPTSSNGYSWILGPVDWDTAGTLTLGAGTYYFAYTVNGTFPGTSTDFRLTFTDATGVVPEPMTLTLAALGAGAAAVRVRRPRA